MANYQKNFRKYPPDILKGIYNINFGRQIEYSFNILCLERRKLQLNQPHEYVTQVLDYLELIENST